MTVSSYGSNQFKKHIKRLIEENLTGFTFVPSIRKREPEMISSEHGLSFAINAVMKSHSSAWELRKVAKQIRMSLSDSSKWKFKGSFHFESSLELRYLLKLILFGENTTNLTDFKLDEVNRTVNILSQFVSVNFKSNKSVRESAIDFVEKHEITLAKV